MPADGDKEPLAVLNTLEPVFDLGIASPPSHPIFRGEDRALVTDCDKQAISISYTSQALVRARILTEPVRAINRGHNGSFVSHGYKDPVAVRDSMKGTRGA